ncbi:hypothetical protein OIG29_01330 [Neisseria meningitidis]|uniref:Uncharacterized protein n=2 Tax=Neisseria meningitidis TaxID=487 RepID=E6MWK3_NEIMH|nr:hypothetical protein [Neisseria meningitidis]EFV63966.1 hypothetical protein NMH_1043 [Neisseria meningitidis H44/76]EHP15274.1 hypothetical protein NMY220_1096 [Neisseria meningitidis NM220]CCA44669.1 hypothetical protein NMALPHA522_1128 [Neisseria meningitidis alpha522]MCV6777615.1 hypothetical protein [Neisseria meningitidis]MCV6780058.1 hypothetical protein [Neisseria meningitidis]
MGNFLRYQCRLKKTGTVDFLMKFGEVLPVRVHCVLIYSGLNLNQYSVASP